MADRFVLDDVPKIEFYQGNRCPEDIPFPSVVRAWLEYAGEADYGCSHVKTSGKPCVGCTYAYLIGTSGAAFHLNWKPGWHMDNNTIHNMSDDPEAPFVRALESVGYSCEWIGKTQGEATMRARIVETLRETRRPMVAFGVVGPPEPVLICGYDEGGDVLIGWSFFQGMPEFNAGVEFEPSGYFRKRNWFAETECVGIIGGKHEPRPMREICRDALDWGVKVARTPLTYGDRHNGLAAYAAWAEHLLMDDEFTSDDLPALMERYMVHFDATGTVAEARWYGSMFFGHAAKHLPEMADELAAAAKCFVAEHDIMWAVWEFAGGNGISEAHARKLAEPGIRRRITPMIELSREKCEQAVGLVERGLAELRR